MFTLEYSKSLVIIEDDWLHWMRLSGYNIIMTLNDTKTLSHWKQEGEVRDDFKENRLNK